MRTRLVVTAIVLLLLLAVFPLFAEPSTDGQTLYLRACATCHGIDGRGADQDLVGFETPLPDFTDCNFATREPNADWLAVAHQGGPVRGFAQMMAAFGEALATAELEAILDHIRT
ncbi:MAG: cytochrome c, partial [Thermoanaerobaculia bacterium]|nr:cytochrome c [Thermoanaerobaculia bacterium]